MYRITFYTSLFAAESRLLSYFMMKIIGNIPNMCELGILRVVLIFKMYRE